MRIVPERRAGLVRTAGFALLLLGVAWSLGALSAWPWVATAPDWAVLRVSLRHVSDFSEAVRHKSEKEEEEERERIEKLARHMRPLDSSRPATGRRVDARLSVSIDEQTLLERTYRPTGFRHDGPIYGYAEIPVAPGHHVVTVTLVDLAPGAHGESITREVEFVPGAAPLVEYVHGAGWHEE
jgi:hypothetical protein